MRVGSLLCTVHRPGGCTERRTLSRHHTVGSHRQTRERWRRDGACLNCDPDKAPSKELNDDTIIMIMMNNVKLAKNIE